jgi:hypothetical protein
MPHISQRRQELNILGDSKDNVIAERLLIRRSIRLHELLADVENCPLLELKHLRLCHLDELLIHIKEEEEKIELRGCLSCLPHRSVQFDDMFDRLVSTCDVPHFWQMARMDFSTSLHIVSLIQDHPVFQTNAASYQKQRQVW